MKIKKLHVDFSGLRELKNAVTIENEYLELLNEAGRLDDEYISAAIQLYSDEKASQDKESLKKGFTSTISVFINEEFYNDFTLHAEVCVVHAASPIVEVTQ